jgi:hypothetical protein
MPATGAARRVEPWPSTVARLVLRANGRTLLPRSVLLAHESATVGFDTHLPRVFQNVSLQLRPTCSAGSFVSSQARTVRLPKTKTRAAS